MSKTIDQNPKISDTILFDLYTTDDSGNIADPYKVDQVIIYFIERDYTSDNFQSYDIDIQDFTTTFHYKDAVPFKVYGTDDFPAWLSTDIPHAFLTNVDTGHFQLEWTPELAREGDYFLCYTWTPLPAGDSFSKLIQFYLGGDLSPPTLPSHQTDPDKYNTMLERLTPETCKLSLGIGDLTPDVLNRTNQAVALGFTEVENFVNQIVDLQDANVVQEAFLPYLANFFRWKLRSADSTLWRRQVRRAIPLYKKKGTLDGLTEALAASGITFNNITYYWQIVSPATWQEAFVYNGSDHNFNLSKKALLPVTSDNFHVWYRLQSSSSYSEIFDFTITNNDTPNINCPPGTDTQSVLTISDSVFLDNNISIGDIIKVLYKVAEPADQTVEDYIQSLPLADQRDEFTVTLPVKNWNVRLIADDDVFFPMICQVKHPFAYPVVYGKIRTLFPYSENIYNMEEYNGSTRDSNEPCDLDDSFYDVCSCCRSSKISVDVGIDQLSDNRIIEAEEVIKDFIPFHAQLHSINYNGVINEFVPPPLENVECLMQIQINDQIMTTQFDFNRIVEDGASDADELTRSMLADADTESYLTTILHHGIGTNAGVTIYSPGIQFGEINIAPNNMLEILSGGYNGVYSLAKNGSIATADVVGINSLAIAPLNASGFPFRFSNILYTENGVSVYQDDYIIFSDPDMDFALYPIPDDETWHIQIISGVFAGNYTIDAILPDNTLLLVFSSVLIPANDIVGLPYHLKAPGNITIASGSNGQIAINNRGRVESGLALEYGVQKGDYIQINNVQYEIWSIAERPVSPTVDKFFIDGYGSGDHVGSVNIKILHREASSIGYISFRDLIINTGVGSGINFETYLGIQDGQNPTANPVENSHFKANYLIVIDGVYYKISDINGAFIYLSGPLLEWGLVGTSVDFTVTWLKNKPVTTQNHRSYAYIDRRGDNSYFIVEEDVLPMSAAALNNPEGIKEKIQVKEKIWFTVETR